MTNTHRTPPSPTQTDLHIGTDLRTRREAREENIADIARTLKIKPEFLHAIERLDAEKMPALGYALGYVRSYAAYLGMDGTQAVARYKADSAISEDLNRNTLPHFVPKTKIRLPRGFASTFAVLAIAAGVTYWYSANAPKLATPETSEQPLSEDNYAPNALPDDPSVLSLKATAPSWVEVTDASGRTIMSRIMITGESWSVSSEGPLRLSARDGGAIELYKGRERLGPFGEKGTPFTDIPLAASTLIPALQDIPLITIPAKTE